MSRSPSQPFLGPLAGGRVVVGGERGKPTQATLRLIGREADRGQVQSPSDGSVANFFERSFAA
ncbi:hypothetical protein thsrh120_54150 [Rhizobium sp. No.120]